MVNPMSLFLMSTSFLLSVILPLIVIIFLCVTKRIAFRGVLAGLSLFCIVEIVWMLLFGLLFQFGGTFFQTNIWITNIVPTAVMALFLAFGRYYMNKTILSDLSTWRGNCAFGLGYGFFYAIMYHGLQIFNDMMASVTINEGLHEGNSVVDYVAENQDRLVNTPYLEFLLPGINAVAAIIMQIALCLIVVYALRQKKMVFVWLAVVMQTVIWSLFGILQQVWGSWVSTGLFVAGAVGAVVWIVKSKEIFDDEVKRPFSRRSPLL